MLSRVESEEQSQTKCLGVPVDAFCGVPYIEAKMVDEITPGGRVRCLVAAKSGGRECHIAGGVASRLSRDMSTAPYLG